MGVHYSVYAEVRIGCKWYNLNPLFQRENGQLDICPILHGRSWLKDAYEMLEEMGYAYGRPDNLSKEVRQVFKYSDDEPYAPDLHINTYKDFYDRAMFLVNYGKSVKSMVKAHKPTRYQGYVSKVAIAAYEIDEYDTINNWLTEEEYKVLSERQKRMYTYYEWDEPDDWYKVFNMLVRKVDCMLGCFCEWADYAIKDADFDERQPTADYVRLIVYQD